MNEQEGLGPTLAELHRVPFGGPDLLPSILVVDGRSTDRTVEIAHEYGVRVLVQQGRGKGAAIREGLAGARASGYEYVGVLDADNTYPATALPALFELLALGTDLVIGMRRPERPAQAELRELVHRVGNGLLNYAAAQASGQPVLDICSGFWGVRLDRLEGIPLESEGFEVESELFLKAFRAGLQVAQLPITYRPRAGVAKLRAFHDGSRIFLSILRNSVRPVGHAGMPPPGAGGTPVPVGPMANLRRTLHGLNPDRVVVLTARDRFAEADRLATQFGAGAPHAEVITAVLAPHWAREWDRASRLLAPGPGGVSTVVVLLPGPRTPTDPLPASLIGIPRSQRIVEMATEGDANEGPAASADWARQGDRLRAERVPSGRRGALFILGATLEPSWITRELALLQANGAGDPVRVYRRNSPASSAIGRVGRWPSETFHRVFPSRTEVSGS